MDRERTSHIACVIKKLPTIMEPEDSLLPLTLSWANLFAVLLKFSSFTVFYHYCLLLNLF